jgi:hypothetical protein
VGSVNRGVFLALFRGFKGLLLIYSRLGIRPLFEVRSSIGSGASLSLSDTPSISLSSSLIVVADEVKVVFT